MSQTTAKTLVQRDAGLQPPLYAKRDIALVRGEGVHLWDHAASALIAREAGASTLLTEGTSGREALVVAPQDGFEELLAAVREAGLVV